MLCFSLSNENQWLINHPPSLSFHSPGNLPGHFRSPVNCFSQCRVLRRVAFSMGISREANLQNCLFQKVNNVSLVDLTERTGLEVAYREKQEDQNERSRGTTLGIIFGQKKVYFGLQITLQWKRDYMCHHILLNTEIKNSKISEYDHRDSLTHNM